MASNSAMAFSSAATRAERRIFSVRLIGMFIRNDRRKSTVAEGSDKMTSRSAIAPRDHRLIICIPTIMIEKPAIEVL
jgi:hypothetical protein